MSDPALTTVDVDAWVKAASDNPQEYAVRRVMRLILYAVADSPVLKSKMVIKGGVLLALAYGTTRHTKDLDFSTDRKQQEENIQAILTEINRVLIQARAVDEEVLCRVQSHRLKPPGSHASFPTLRISMGYAFKGQQQYRRMVQGRESAQTLTVDLSFNEKTCITSAIVMDGHEIGAYSLYDQIAEKYRAIIQQTADRRNRVRRQDAYDIFTIIDKGYLATAEDKAILLATMREKFAARRVPCERDIINEPEIAERSAKEYARLQDEVEGELPAFERAFGVVRKFYLSLPWDE